MAIRQFAIVAALIPTIVVAAYVPGTNTTWNASFAAATLIANQGLVPAAIVLAAETLDNKSVAVGNIDAAKLNGLAITSLTCVASGPAATGVLVLNMLTSTAALADSKFHRWIAHGIAVTMGAHFSQVDVSVKAGVRRLTTDDAGRRLTATVTANYNVYNPNRGRNIGLGIGLGLIAPAAGLGVGLGLGLKRGNPVTTPVPQNPVAIVAAPVTAAVPTVVPTEAPSSGSSMPLWAGILLGLAVLACIGAAVFFGTQKKDKKKRAVKKAAPVVEEFRVVEEVMPMLAPLQTYQPAPMMQTYQPVTYAAPAPAYTTISRAF